MSYSVSKLITNAFYLSKVRSKDFQTVGGDDITVGLMLLNEVLGETSANTRMIPYYQEYVTAAVIGQEKYFIPDLVEPMSLTFNMTTVRYATNRLSRFQFHATTRIDGVEALPFDASFERTLGGCNLYVQYLPSDTYPFKIWGKFALPLYSYGDLGTDLMLAYDMFYIRNLRYKLAREVCNYYGVQLDPQVKAVMDEISANVNSLNTIDLTSQKLNLYDDKNGISWAMVNLGKGFTPAD